jgi:hypothetical protein
VTTIFIPTNGGRPPNNELTGKPAVLPTDNRPTHTRAGVLTTLKEHNVRVITFPPQTTYIVRTFDLGLFGALKKKMPEELLIGSDNLAVRFLLEALHSLKQTVVEDNMVCCASGGKVASKSGIQRDLGR